MLGIQNFAWARVISTDPTVSSGETVSITLTTTNAVSSFKASLVDAGGLTFVSVTRGSGFDNGAANGSTVNGATTGEPTKTLATYTFKAPETTETKKYTVTFQVTGMDNEADTTNTSTVTVKGTGSGNTGGNSKPEDPNENPQGNGGNAGTATTSHNFRDVNDTVYATDTVRVRTAPETGDTLGQLKKGDSVKRTGIGDSGWDRVSYKGHTAYVSQKYLTTTPPKGTEEPKEEEPTTPEEPEKPTETTPEEPQQPEVVAANVALSGITIQEGKLSPAFQKDVTEYALTVGEEVKELHIEATTEDTNSKVEITGNTELKLGSNTVKITVKATDGTTKTYTIHVTKRGESDLALTTLKISALNLEVPLEEGKYEYAFKLESEKLIKELEFTALANEEGARIEITGNKDLKEGENIINITITSANGEEQVNYTITVNNQLKPGATTDGLPIDVTTAIVVGTILLTAYIIALLFIWKYVEEQKEKKEEFEEDIPQEEMEAIGANAKAYTFDEVEDIMHYEELQQTEQQEPEEPKQTMQEQIEEDFEERGMKKKKGKHF